MTGWTGIRSRWPKLLRVLGLCLLVSAALSTASAQNTKTASDKPDPVLSGDELKTRLEAHRKELEDWHRRLVADYDNPVVAQKFTALLGQFRPNEPLGSQADTMRQSMRMWMRSFRDFVDRHLLHLVQVNTSLGKFELITNMKQSELDKIDAGMQLLGEYDAEVRAMLERYIQKFAEGPKYPPRESRPYSPNGAPAEYGTAAGGARPSDDLLEAARQDWWPRLIPTLDPWHYKFSFADQEAYKTGEALRILSLLMLFQAFPSFPAQGHIFLYVQCADGLQVVEEFYPGVNMVAEAQFDPALKDKQEVELELKVGGKSVKLNAKRYGKEGILYRTDAFVVSEGSDDGAVFNPTSAKGGDR